MRLAPLIRCSLLIAAVAAAFAHAGPAAIRAEEPAPKRIYIAPDDHTDYMWTMDEEGYRKAFIEMIDYYLAQADATQGNPSHTQGRWNCDGSFWLWVYEQNKPEEFPRVIERIRDGHMSAPLTALVSCYGGQPAEAVLRGMYYAGELERRYDLRFSLAVAMEDQTIPYGLGALWHGAGAKYTWRGICACASKIKNAGDREHEIYWWKGPDGSRLLTKWNSIFQKGNKTLGGYAEAYDPAAIVDFIDTDAEFQKRYPYNVAGAFGKGWDHEKTLTDEFIKVAQEKTTPEREVIVSNEEDFFKDFQHAHGADLPELSSAFGNEWELYSASMSELTGSVRRAVEKLRSAEAMATLVALQQPDFLKDLRAERDNAWMDLGIFWEHDWTADSGRISRDKRAAWARRVGGEVVAYVDKVQDQSKAALGKLIRREGDLPRFFAFNALSWPRTDAADLPWTQTDPVHVVDLATGEEVPSQIVGEGETRRLRILASDVPPLGYKVFEIRPGKGKTFTPAARVSDGVIENSVYRLTVAERGAVTNLIDKTHGNREYAREIDGRWINDLGNGAGALEIENAGPVSVTLRATGAAPLQHESRITLYRDGRRIDFDNEIQQNFGNVQTWSFAFNLDKPDVQHEEVGAVIRAKLLDDGGQYSPRNARYDWLTMNHFVDMGGADGAGVTLSNADLAFMKIGRSTPTSLDTETPQISPLAGGQVDGARLGIPNQGGDTRFTQRFALETRDVYDPVAAMRFSLEHQNPLVCGMVEGGNAYDGRSYSLLKSEPDDVFVWAVKPAEEGIDQGVIVRLWNVASTPATTAIDFAFDPRQAVQTTHIETDLEPVALNGSSLPLNLAPQQWQTYRLKTK